MLLVIDKILTMVIIGITIMFFLLLAYFIIQCMRGKDKK